jgi:hypothetical protein
MAIVAHPFSTAPTRAERRLHTEPKALQKRLGKARGEAGGHKKTRPRGALRDPSQRADRLPRVMHCEESDLHMLPGSPLPRLRFRPARRPNGQSSLNKIGFNMPHYGPVSADEFA